MARIAYVLVDGPFPGTNLDGEEVATYSVLACDAEDEPVKESRFSTGKAAFAFGERVAKNHAVELVVDCTIRS